MCAIKTTSSCRVCWCFRHITTTFINGWTTSGTLLWCRPLSSTSRWNLSNIVTDTQDAVLLLFYLLQLQRLQWRQWRTENNTVIHKCWRNFYIVFLTGSTFQPISVNSFYILYVIVFELSKKQHQHFSFYIITVSIDANLPIYERSH